MKHALAAVLGLVAVSIPVAAQQASTALPAEAVGEARTVNSDLALDFSRAGAASSVDAPTLVQSLPMLALLDGRTFPVPSAIGRMGMAPIEFPALAYIAPSARPESRKLIYNEDVQTTAVDLRAREYYYGGEVGVFYGKSTGKHGGEDFGSYIVGTVGNDKVQITAGASYQESSIHVPRFSR